MKNAFRTYSLLLAAVLVLSVTARAAAAADAADAADAGAAAQDQYQFAEALFIQQDFQSAIEEYQTVLDKFATSTKAGAARFRIGECYLRLNQYKKSVQAFTDALKQQPKAPEAALGWYNLGRAQSELKQYTAAEKAFRQAAKAGKDKVKEEALVGLGESLVQLQRLADAVPVYQQFLAAFPKSEHAPAIRFSLGWALAKLKRHKEAIPVFQQLIKLHPKAKITRRARLALADSLTSAGRYDEAAALLQQLMAGGGADTDAAALRLAWNTFARGDKAKSAELFIAYANQHPGEATAATSLYNAGIAAFELGRHQQVVDLFTRLRRKYPNSPEAGGLDFWLGLSLFELGRAAEAEPILDRLMKAGKVTRDHQPTLLYTLAEARVRLKKYAAAVTVFQQLLRDFPTCRYAANAWYSMASCHEKLKDLPTAIVDLQTVLKQFPDNALRAQALFALGEYLYRAGRKAAALAPLRELAKAQQADARVLYRLGWTEFDLQHFSEAEAAFSRLADKKEAFYHEALYMAGLSAEQQKKPSNAKKWYRLLVDEKTADPWMEKAFYRLGLLLPAAEQDAEYARFAARFPQSRLLPGLKMKIAENQFDLKAFSRAETLYRELLRLFPQADPVTRAAAAYGLGWALVKQKKEKAAEPFFAQAEANKAAPEKMRRDARLQRAEIAYRAKEYATALPLFASLKDGERVPAERALYMYAWCARRLGKKTEAQKAFQAVTERFPKSVYLADACLRDAEFLRDAGRLASARAVLEQGLKRPQDPLREDLLHLYGDILVAQKDWRRLLESCEAQRQEYPKSSRDYLVSFRLGLAYRGLGLLDKAEAAFRRTIAQTETIEAARAQFNIATLYMTRKDYETAAKQFLRVELLYDYPELSPRALYHAVDAFCLVGPKAKRRAGIYVRKLQKDYAKSDWTKKAEKRLAEVADVTTPEKKDKK